MSEPKHPAKKSKKKRPAPVYVPVNYPVWLGAASFAWAVVGWLIASAAPRLAFVPGASALHLLFPAVTVALLAVNLALAVRSLLRGAHVLRLVVVTGVEVALFTTLFFQLYAHGGAELYDAPGPTTPWQWFQFSAAHALRAGDVFDTIEAYGWGVQPVKHASWVVGVFVIAYHVVVDVFFLGLVWAAVGRFRETVLADDEFRGMVVRLGAAAFVIWFLAWVVVAFFVRPWRGADIPLWFLENVIRVVDFADIMESFGWRLHTLPREGVVGTLTLFCRLWIGLGLAFALTRKRKPPPRRVLTPPDTPAAPYWRLRAGALAGMAVVLFATGLIAWLMAGSPAQSLAAAVAEGPDDRAESALRALRRMGPSAGAAVPSLTAARPAASPAVRDGITRTLGYLGTSATEPLRTIALGEGADTAGPAVDALANVGGAAAPDLVAVWSGTADDAVKARAEAAIRSVGGAGVGPLIESFTPENADGHYVWLGKLDANWRLRGTGNPTARACHELEELNRRARSVEVADSAAAMTQARACGTASRELLDAAYDALGHLDAGLHTAAAGIVIAAGPKETPKVLQLARAAPEDRGVPNGVIVVLREPSMWSPAVLADANTLPVLQSLLVRSEGFPIALPHLSHYGPAAAAAAPVLIRKVAESDAAGRGAVRAALGRIHPAWKDDPALTAALPVLLYQLPGLPKAEADELYAALRPISDDTAASLVLVMRKRLGEVNEQYRGSYGWHSVTSPPQYTKSLDEVYGPVERLGPTAKALVPHLKNQIRINRKELNDPKTTLVTARLAVTIGRVGGSAEDSIPATIAAVGFGPEGQAYLRKQGKAALPFVTDLLEAREDETLLRGFTAVTALGRDAEPLVPRLLAMLPNSNRRARSFGTDDVWQINELVRALSAADPDWWGRPEAATALGRMLQITAPSEAATTERRRVLDVIAGADAAQIPKVAAGALRVGVIDVPVRDLFDKLAPGWRADPAVKAAAPELVPRVADRWVGVAAERTVLDLGPTGVDALAAALAGLNNEAIAGRTGYVKGADVRDQAVRLLAKFNPPAKAAAPALLALAAKPRLHPEAVPLVLDALDKAAPGWPADAALADAAKAAADALLARAAESPLFVGYAGRCGAAVGPELARQFETAGSDPNAVGVLERIAAAGPAAKGALPALTKVATSKDGRNRAAVIETMSKVGDAALVPTLAPLLLDPDAKVRAAAVPALDRIDPKWKAKPAAKALVPTAKGQLTAAEAGKRAGGAEVLGLLGDATQVPALCPVVLDTEPTVRAAAGAALDRVDADWRAKPAAKAAAAAAVKQLADPAARKRYDAVGALEVLRPPTAAAALEQLLTRETDANTRQYAELVLGRLRKGP